MGKALQAVRMPFEFLHMFTATYISAVVMLGLLWPMGITVYALDVARLIQVDWRSLTIAGAFCVAYQVVARPFYRPAPTEDFLSAWAGLPVAMIVTGMAVAGAGMGLILRLAFWLASTVFG